MPEVKNNEKAIKKNSLRLHFFISFFSRIFRWYFWRIKQSKLRCSKKPGCKENTWASQQQISQAAGGEVKLTVLRDTDIIELQAPVVQGYLYDKPLPHNEFEKRLKDPVYSGRVD